MLLEKNPVFSWIWNDIEIENFSRKIIFVVKQLQSAGCITDQWDIRTSWTGDSL